MIRLLIRLVLISLLGCATAAADEIAFGDFGPGTSIYALGHQDKWNLDEESLNQWYTTVGKASGPLFLISPDGHATVDASTWDGDKSKGAKAYSLLQVIEISEAGEYDFSYAYRIADGYEESSMVRVIGISDDASLGFSIHLNGSAATLSGASGTTLYGNDANLIASDDWLLGGGLLDITDDYTHIAVLTWFEWDGNVGTPSLGQVDDFELKQSKSGDGMSVPEPGTLALVGTAIIGVVGYSLRRRM